MPPLLYSSSGILRYSQEEYKLIVEVDKNLANYYLALTPKWLNVKRGRWAPHITVVRGYKETPVHLEHWGKYEGEEIKFYYSPTLQTGKVYYWLNVFCVRLEEIRKELGLDISSQWTRPPDGFMRCFHTTVGNCKE